MLNVQTASHPTPLPSLRIFLSLQPKLILNVGAPIGVFQAATSRGVSEQNALLLAAVFPLIGIGASAVRQRRIDPIGVASLAAIVLGAALSLVFHDPRILLVKDSAVTGLIGLAFIGSLLAPRPLIFVLARHLAAHRPAGQAELDARWQSSPRFRAVMRRLTVLWGIGLLGEATARVSLSVVVAPATLMALSPVLMVTTVAPLLAITWRARARAQRA
jgi:hypothetical protein